MTLERGHPSTITRLAIGSVENLTGVVYENKNKK